MQPSAHARLSLPDLPPDVASALVTACQAPITWAPDRRQLCYGDGKHDLQSVRLACKAFRKFVDENVGELVLKVPLAVEQEQPVANRFPQCRSLNLLVDLGQDQPDTDDVPVFPRFLTAEDLRRVTNLRVSTVSTFLQLDPIKFISAVPMLRFLDLSGLSTSQLVCSWAELCGHISTSLHKMEELRLPCYRALPASDLIEPLVGALARMPQLRRLHVVVAFLCLDQDRFTISTGDAAVAVPSSDLVNRLPDHLQELQLYDRSRSGRNLTLTFRQGGRLDSFRVSGFNVEHMTVQQLLGILPQLQGLRQFPPASERLPLLRLGELTLRDRPDAQLLRSLPGMLQHVVRLELGHVVVDDTALERLVQVLQLVQRRPDKLTLHVGGKHHFTLSHLQLPGGADPGAAAGGSSSSSMGAALPTAEEVAWRVVKRMASGDPIAVPVTAPAGPCNANGVQKHPDAAAAAAEAEAAAAAAAAEAKAAAAAEEAAEEAAKAASVWEAVAEAAANAAKAADVAAKAARKAARTARAARAARAAVTSKAAVAAEAGAAAKEVVATNEGRNAGRDCLPYLLLLTGKRLSGLRESAEVRADWWRSMRRLFDVPLCSRARRDEHPLRAYSQLPAVAGDILLLEYSCNGWAVEEVEAAVASWREDEWRRTRWRAALRTVGTALKPAAAGGAGAAATPAAGAVAAKSAGAAPSPDELDWLEVRRVPVVPTPPEGKPLAGIEGGKRVYLKLVEEELQSLYSSALCGQPRSRDGGSSDGGGAEGWEASAEGLLLQRISVLAGQLIAFP